MGGEDNLVYAGKKKIYQIIMSRLFDNKKEQNFITYQISNNIIY